MEAMNKPLPVKGYRAQSDVKIEVVNHNKEVEEIVLRACDSLKQNPDVDQRWLAIGRTHIEQGFMAINRAIFKPDRVQLESDMASEADVKAGKAAPAPEPAKPSE